MVFLLTMKKEFICVQPRSSTAKKDFVEFMHELHSCVVNKREHGMLNLSSISGKYDFEMFESISTIHRVSYETRS